MVWESGGKKHERQYWGYRSYFAGSVIFNKQSWDSKTIDWRNYREMVAGYPYPGRDFAADSEKE